MSVTTSYAEKFFCFLFFSSVFFFPLSPPSFLVLSWTTTITHAGDNTFKRKNDEEIKQARYFKGYIYITYNHFDKRLPPFVITKRERERKNGSTHPYFQNVRHFLS